MPLEINKIEWDAPNPDHVVWDEAPQTGQGGVMDAAIDMARAVPGGLAKGLTAIAGLPGDVNDLLDAGANKLRSLVSPDAQPLSTRTPLSLPNSSQFNNAVSSPFGGYYQPKTTAGEYAQTVASFAPNALMPGSALARAARVVVPGVASEAAGQATKDSKYEPFARAGGALLGGLGVGMAEDALASRAAQAASPAPSLEDLRSQASKIYSDARAADVTISPDAYDNLVGDIKATVKDAGFHPKLHPKVDGVLDALSEPAGSAVPLDDLERLRRVAQGASRSIEPDERRIGSMILDKIDDFQENLSPSQVASGDASVGATLSDARSLWAKMRKSETINDLIDRAETRATTANGNFAAALRGEFQALARNKKAMRGFSGAEADAIRKVATVGPTDSVLAALGVLRPRGLIGWGELATGVAAPGAALPMIGAAAVGQGSQTLLNANTARNARLASELMRRGSAVNQPQTVIPRDLLLSTLLSQGAH